MAFETAVEPSLADKVSFLGRPQTYGLGEAVRLRETHMSWLFFPDDAVYKLKKPVRLPYLDFSTLARREAACRAEATLNLCLARPIYLGVTPLALGPEGLALGGQGRVVDWLVVMRRFDESRTLESLLRARKVDAADIARLTNVLTRFYRRTRTLHPAPASRLRDWRDLLKANLDVLLDPALGLRSSAVRYVASVQRRFLRRRANLLRHRRIVDGHGDLRPEHIWLGEPLCIIDRLEFNPTFRAVDPFDEIAFLDLECERLGAPQVGQRIRRRMIAALHDGPPEALYLFYRCTRAMLRARLAIAHLMEPVPRTPAKWPPLARAYLALAVRDARRLERLI
ncbi:MAG: hypothetical protein ACM3YN_10645 [Parcubacteria group bacterium]